MAQTSKNRRKSREAAKDLRTQWELFNGDLAGIDQKGMERVFPNVNDRLNYIKALIEGL